MTTLNQRTMLNELLDIARRDRARRSRWRKFGKFIGTFVLAQIQRTLISLVFGWYLMLAVGVAHAEWLPALPTIGYWWACLLVWLLRGVFSATQQPSKDGAR
jgi:hypothetical protein